MHKNKKKGNRWENEVARRFREALGDETIRRGFQARGGGAEVADVVAPGLHLECKHEQKVDWRAAFRQALKDLEKRRGVPGVPAPMPVAVCRDQRNPAPSPFVVLPGSFSSVIPAGRKVELVALMNRQDVRMGLLKAQARAPEGALALCRAPLDDSEVYLMGLDEFIQVWAEIQNQN